MGYILYNNKLKPVLEIELPEFAVKTLAAKGKIKLPLTPNWELGEIVESVPEINEIHDLEIVMKSVKDNDGVIRQIMVVEDEKTAVDFSMRRLQWGKVTQE